MKDRSADRKNPPQDERRDEVYTIPNEASCSPEFTKDCMIWE